MTAIHPALPFETKRLRSKERRGSNQHDRHLSSAIILGPPPKPLLDRWFASITQHLTKDQLKAQAARQNCGKPGRRKGEPWTPRRRDRARSEPSLAPVPDEVLTALREARAARFERRSSRLMLLQALLLERRTLQKPSNHWRNRPNRT